jgi:hypothetical protein
MTAAESAKYIGKTCFVKMAEGLKIKFIIKDMKQAYGETNVCIIPVTGVGETWVRLYRCDIQHTEGGTS